MANTEMQRANKETREAWNQNAGFWDARMGEGNDFIEMLIWPAVERLLAPQPGERVLDIACGNGLTARRLAVKGAQVLALDFAQEMIAHAIARTGKNRERIEYRVLDATDEQALLTLGEGQFDAALCNMALFDMAEIAPLTRALARLLRPGGRYVFSVLHPCFNNPYVTQVGEQEDRDGSIITTYSVKVRSYMSNTVTHALAMRNQPAPQLVFHRPLATLFGICFAAGFVIDGMEERAFPPGHEPGTHPLAWSGRFSEIPPVLVARARLQASMTIQS